VGTADADRLPGLDRLRPDVVFSDLTHDSLIESPAGATAASDAILAVVTAVRTGTPFSGPAAGDR